jgi:hypothetical protein
VFKLDAMYRDDREALHLRADALEKELATSRARGRAAEVERGRLEREVRRLAGERAPQQRLPRIAIVVSVIATFVGVFAYRVIFTKPVGRSASRLPAPAAAPTTAPGPCATSCDCPPGGLCEEGACSHGSSNLGAAALPLVRPEIHAAIEALEPSVRACTAGQPTGAALVRLTFTPDGRVTGAVADEALDPGARACISDALVGARVAPFSDRTSCVDHPLRLGTP